MAPPLRVAPALALLLSLPFASPARAQAGTLDPSFGDGGWVVPSLGEDDSGAQAVLAQPDGRLLLAATVRRDGHYATALLRLLPDGSPDSTFGDGGLVIAAPPGLSATASDALLLPDGRVVTAGGAGQGVALARFTSNGALDSTFGSGGFATSAIVTGYGVGLRVTAAAALPDGRLVVVGERGIMDVGYDDWSIVVAVHTPDGALDPTFGGAGFVITGGESSVERASDVAVQPDGRVLVAGSIGGTMAVLRYAPDGSLDPTFGTGGVATALPAASAEAVRLLPDGRVLVAGYVFAAGAADVALARFTPDGVLDSTFGSGGIVTTAVAPGFDLARDLVVLPDGRSVAAGYAIPPPPAPNAFAIVGYTAGGALDPSFGAGGIVRASFGSSGARASALALQADGRLVAAGGIGAGTAVARFLGGGGVPTEPGPPRAGVVVHPPRPNPTAGAASLVLELPEAEVTRVAAFDVLGREVALLHDGPLPAGTHVVELDVSTLRPGVYVIRTEAGGGLSAVRLTIAR